MCTWARTVLARHSLLLVCSLCVCACTFVAMHSLREVRLLVVRSLCDCARTFGRCILCLWCDHCLCVNNCGDAFSACGVIVMCPCEQNCGDAFSPCVCALNCGDAFCPCGVIIVCLCVAQLWRCSLCLWCDRCVAARNCGDAFCSCGLIVICLRALVASHSLLVVCALCSRARTIVTLHSLLVV